MQTYARQGGTSNLFVNDDGLQLISPEERDARIAYYEDHGIGWVARPPHQDDKKTKKGVKAQPGFKRAGRFKKASNMNYALDLSLRLERHLEALKEEREMRRVAANENGTVESEEENARMSMSNNHSSPSSSRHETDGPRVAFGSTTNVQKIGGNATQEEDLEEKALELAVEEIVSEAPIDPGVPSTDASDPESGPVDPKAAWRPWAANGKACRVGEIVLLVDSDTVVPEVRLCYVIES